MLNHFGDRLNELRLERGLTQEILAKIFNTGKASISHYESGGRLPDAYAIVEYAKFFNVSTDYILGVSGERQQGEASSIESDIKEIKELLHAKAPNENIGKSIIELMMKYGEIDPREKISDEHISKILKIFETALEMRGIWRG